MILVLIYLSRCTLYTPPVFVYEICRFSPFLYQYSTESEKHPWDALHAYFTPLPAAEVLARCSVYCNVDGEMQQASRLWALCTK